MTSTDPNQAAYAASKNDAAIVSSTCPLMNKNVQLLPLRYGLTEHIDPSTELIMPFKLESRPLGIRLVRDGYLYLLNNNTGNLYEYELKDGVVGKMVYKGAEVAKNKRIEEVDVPNLIFSKASTLYVNYSELQWTDRKCMQVLLNHKDRQYFMQEVSLAKADPLNGGIHLLTPEQTENWLAELQSNDANNERQDKNAESKGGFHAEEQETYIWEKPSADQAESAPKNSSRFRNIPTGKLASNILPDYEHDALFLVLRDDIGVMRDLAQYQDHVVDWIGEWRQGGASPENNERDYMIACYIESLTQINNHQLSNLDDPAAQAMLDDLAKLPEPAQSNTRQAILDYLNDKDTNDHWGRGGIKHPPELDIVLDEIKKKLTKFPTRDRIEAVASELMPAIEYYYFMQSMNNADPSFVEIHTDTIMQLKKSNDTRVKDILSGAKFGQRGINDLIDRPAMDQFLATQRLKLERWNALLEQITTDRTQMTIENRFHRAAWYYDAQQAEQVGIAFTTQYACLKDICRSDTAVEKIYTWLEEHPAYDRPLFHTLPEQEQTQIHVQYAQINALGYALVNVGKDLLQKLRALEQGKLPVIDDLPDNIKILAKSVQDTLNPALSYGINRTMNEFFKNVGEKKLPELHRMLQGLPKAIKVRLIEAAKHEGLTFTVASEAGMLQLQKDIKAFFAGDQKLGELIKDRKISNADSNQGHKSPKSKGLLEKIIQLEKDLKPIKARLVAAISPINELPDESVRTVGATKTSAGLTVILSPDKNKQLAGIMSNMRNGYGATGNFSKLGDGIGLAVAIAQLVNLWVIINEIFAQPADKINYTQLISPALSAAAATFSAAQGIADNALNTRAVHLTKTLQEHGINATHVQMGKMHLGLGFISYGAAFFASALSSMDHAGNLMEAIRSGNLEAQKGAAIALTGSAGYMATSAYGLTQTSLAGKAVKQVWTNKAARDAAWAVAGRGLASTFFRFNIAGAIFTALELGGTWWYNRNNTTSHEDWLLATPWGSDFNKDKHISLESYQQSLLRVINQPKIKVVHEGRGKWWQDTLFGPSAINIALELPGLSRHVLEEPLSGRPSAQLSLSAYSIISKKHEPSSTAVKWAPITEQIIHSLELLKSGPLQLQFAPPTPQPAIGVIIIEELLLEVKIEQLDLKGAYQSESYSIRFVSSAQGAYDPAEKDAQAAQNAPCAPATWERIYLQRLPEITNEKH